MDIQLGRENRSIYKASAGADQVVYSTRCILERIIIGAAIASSVIQVSDHASSATGNTKLKLTSPAGGFTAGQVVDVNMYFETGIVATQTNQTDVTYVVRPA